IPTYIFYEKTKALDWVNQADFPKVFKLRSGASSWNVRLVKTRRNAIDIVNKAFDKGFDRQPNPLENLKEKWRKYKIGKATEGNVKAAIKRLFVRPVDGTRVGRERNYVYFQDFIPGNDSDIRVIVIDSKAFAIKRMVRENDFRASGSGIIDYREDAFDE